MIDAALSEQARTLLAAAPCSVEMPAGTGKTHLLAAAVLEASRDGKRSLVLTHTHAGVDAMRRRLNSFGVDRRYYHIDTIAGWAFTLARSYEQIGGVEIPADPDWSRTNDYVDAATSVACSEVIKNVHAAAFSHLFVDEYQDCVVSQHEFICSLAAAVSSTVVLGDPLQGIFGFKEPLVQWESVKGSFPAHRIDHVPHRWIGHNEDLGGWLLGIRSQLVVGGSIDLRQTYDSGVKWLPSGNGNSAAVKEAWSHIGHGGTVVLLDRRPEAVAKLSSRLGGNYIFLEEVQGKFMLEMLGKLPPDGSPDLACWLAILAKKCFSGLAGLDKRVLEGLAKGRRVGHLKKDGIKDVLMSLDSLVDSPSYKNLSRSAGVFDRCSKIRLYRREAWRDTLRAVTLSIESERAPSVELAQIRDRMRRVGRPAYRRIASRTLLVKGLEFDHVIITDASRLCDPNNFYVALTRARKSVTVIGRSPVIMLRPEKQAR